MKPFIFAGWLFLAAVAAGAEPLAEALERAALEYGKRVEEAAQELAATREQIARERSPIATRVREAEDRLVMLEAEIARLETLEAQAANQQVQRQSEYQALARNLSYASALALDGLKALENRLLPGEEGIVGDQLKSLRTRLESSASDGDSSASNEFMTFLMERTRNHLGGHAAHGRAMAAEDNRVLEGSFVFFGPDVMFASGQGELVGVVRQREGAPLPTVHEISGWKAGDAAALTKGEEAVFPADATGGRALRLKLAEGSLLDHLRRGGVVGVIILCLGAVAFVIAVWKAAGLRQFSVDKPETIRAALDAIANEPRADAERAISRLSSASRQLFTTGLVHWDKTKEAMEEHLHALIMQERMRHEKRLPLLAVITTASPLLGLLGTVTGMVKTFTLITIYGTGNAAKLSSGISEALVTTELGLIVAIPTLIVHGYFTHRVRRHLSVLQMQAYELVNAAEAAKQRTLADAKV